MTGFLHRSAMAQGELGSESKGLIRWSRLLALTAIAVSMLAIANPAPADAQTIQPLCFWPELSDNPLGENQAAGTIVPLDPTTILRNLVGEELAPKQLNSGRLSFYNTTISRDEGWRAVHTQAGVETVGPLCTAPASNEAVAWEDAGTSLQWLPGATIEANGGAGPGRISWNPAVRDGVPAEFYAVTLWTWPTYTGATKFPKQTFLVDGTTFSREVVVANNGPATVQAWWSDGVSDPSKVAMPERGKDPDEHALVVISDIVDVRCNAASDFCGQRLTWPTVTDRNGVPADEYQLLTVSNGSPTIRLTVPGNVNTAWVPRYGYKLKAVWQDGGSAGGPRAAEARHLWQWIDTPAATDWVHDLRSENRTAQTAEVRFRTDRCVYADYRIVIDEGRKEGNIGIWSDDLRVDGFDTPRTGDCDTEHGITVGSVTAPMVANAQYQVTLRLTDPSTGEVTFVRGSDLEQPATIGRAGEYCFGQRVTITSDSGSTDLLGTTGPDVILSNGGDVDGGGGDDLICSRGGGQRVIRGGEGNDKISLGNSDETAHGGSGNDVILGGGGDDRILGGSGNDWLSGGTGQDIVRGGEGNDKVFGGTGNDRLFGGTGNDRLYGGHGRDLLSGGYGWDWLAGGTGNDHLDGQAGADRLGVAHGQNTWRPDPLDIIMR